MDLTYRYLPPNIARRLPIVCHSTYDNVSRSPSFSNAADVALRAAACSSERNMTSNSMRRYALQIQSQLGRTISAMAPAKGSDEHLLLYPSRCRGSGCVTQLVIALPSCSRRSRVQQRAAVRSAGSSCHRYVHCAAAASTRSLHWPCRRSQAIVCTNQEKAEKSDNGSLQSRGTDIVHRWNTPQPKPHEREVGIGHGDASASIEAPRWPLSVPEDSLSQGYQWFMRRRHSPSRTKVYRVDAERHPCFSA